MSEIQGGHAVNIPIYIIGGLIFVVQFSIAFIVKGFKRGQDKCENDRNKLWKANNKVSDRLSKLEGEHDALCGKHK